jgi:hypothetical protein
MQMQGDAKKMLKDYQGALKDLTTLMFSTQWCNHITIKARWG